MRRRREALAEGVGQGSEEGPETVDPSDPSGRVSAEIMTADRARTLSVLAALSALLIAAPTARAQSVVWTVIDVKSKLDNDGRLHVVETHDLELREGGGFNLTREFGLGADQSIVFRSLKRLGPDAVEQSLEDAEVGLPDRYRYYPMGHVYLSIPSFERGTKIAYRMEYEVVNALSPAWAVAAGKGPLARPMGFEPPLARLREVVADLREAWPQRERLYRLDHDVLFPSRDGPGYVVERVDYQLAFDNAWKLVDPDAELGKAQADQDYRIRRLFERVVDEPPTAVEVSAARTRWIAVGAAVVCVPIFWLLLMVAEGVGNLLAGRGTFETMGARLSALAPEAVAAFMSGGQGPAPTLEAILSRMAGERKVAIEIEPAPSALSAQEAGPDEAVDDEGDDETPPLVKLRRLVPLESLPAFERDLLQQFLVGGRREVTSVELQTLHAEHGLEPWQVVKGLLPAETGRSRSFLAAFFGLASLGGAALQITSMANLDPIPVVIIVDVLFLGGLRIWPRAYWHAGKSWMAAIALLIPGAFASVAAIALLVSANPPLPAQGWVGTAVVALAAYASLLAAARRPWRGEPHATVRELERIRRYAEGELRRPQPRLEDRFVPHLEALGLGPRLEAWRNARGNVVGGDLANLQDTDASGSAPLARPFTGRASVPFKSAHSWADALWVPSAEERKEMDEEEEA